jgi:glycosyltransferase involved in cell wall biosynthesis
MKIWYDVSGIFNWTGNFTGVQRVVYNLGKELHTTDADTGFFIYRHGTFHEVDFNELEERLKANVVVSGQSMERSRRSLGSLQHHMMVGLKKAVRSTPLEAPARAAYIKLRKSYRSLRGTSQQVRPILSPFAKGDVVVVVDGNWQFGGYAHALKKARTHTDIKLVHFVHDLTAVRNPALVNPGAEEIIGGYFKEIFPFTDILIAVSESTRHDIEWFAKRWNLPQPRTDVIISGDDNISRASARAAKKPKAAISKPFILAVGTIEIRKNYMALYYAYKLAQERDIKLPHLVIAGRKGWMAEEAYTLLTEDVETRAKITVLIGPSDRELAWLYNNCRFTVFPSFYEGWGLPVAESLAHGKACISSNTSSMPEVGKDLAVYISPHNPQELVNSIIQLDSDSSQLKKTEAKIKKSYQIRTWEQACTDFLAILSDIS